MLILSRREAEKVLFPGLGISVEITRVQGRSVRLGIQAPDEIRIIRGILTPKLHSRLPRFSNFLFPKSMSRIHQADRNVFILPVQKR